MSSRAAGGECDDTAEKEYARFTRTIRDDISAAMDAGAFPEDLMTAMLDTVLDMADNLCGTPHPVNNVHTVLDQLNEIRATRN